MIQIDMSNKREVRITNKAFHLENNVVILDIELSNYDLTGKTITAVFEPVKIETGALEVVEGIIQIPVYANMVQYGFNYIQLNFRWDENRLEQSGKLIWVIYKSLETTGPAQEDVDIISYLVNEIKSAKETADRVISDVGDVKQALDQSVDDAGTAKDELDSSITTSGTAKSNLEDVIGAVNTKKTELVDTIDNANTKINEITNPDDGTIKKANDAKVALEEKITEAGTAKTQIEDAITNNQIVTLPEFNAHKEDYTQYKDNNNLKIAKVEKDINDYQSTIASVNVNQEAKQKVTGYGAVSLPKNSANGQVSCRLKGHTVTQEFIYTPETMEEWRVGSTSSNKGNNFIELVGRNNISSATISLLVKPNTKYGLLYTVEDFNLNGYLWAGSSYYPFSDVSLTTTNGNKKNILTSRDNWAENKFRFYLSNLETPENKIKISNIRLFELPTGSEIENDFEVLSTDELAQKYPYIKGDSTKSTISASRLKSVSEDETQESVMYLPNVGELRSLPNGVSDEIKVRGGKGELVKRVSDTMEELAEPIITPIEVSGTLLSYPSGTVYIENIVADAGVYTDKLTVLHSDLPIKEVEKVSKVDFMTGQETELDVSQCVVSEDKLSFTHPSLVDGDIVFFTYYYDREGTLGETEIEYYDSRYILKDSVTDKFYKVVPSVANGVLTNTLVEV